MQEAVPFAHAFDFVQEYMQERFVNPMLTYVLVTGGAETTCVWLM